MNLQFHSQAATVALTMNIFCACFSSCPLHPASPQTLTPVICNRSLAHVALYGSTADARQALLEQK